MSETQQSPATQSKWPFENERVGILPYCDAPGALFPDEFLLKLYLDLQADKSLEILFPGFDDGVSMPKFMKYFADRPIIVGMVKEADVMRVAGFGWLHSVEGQTGCRKASCGYAFFKKYWGTSEIREISKMALRYWFTESEVDVMFGFALKRNLLAQRFDAEMGFRKFADIPSFFVKDGKLHDAVGVVMTKQEFLEREGA